MTGNRMKLIFIESKEQIKRALRWQDEGSKIIALSPLVGFELEQMGQKYSCPENYHEREQILAVGEDNYKLLDDFCRFVDEVYSPLLDGLKPAFNQAYHFKIMFDAVTMRTFQVLKILEAEKPNLIVFFGSLDRKIDDSLFFTGESVYSKIVPLVSKQLNIDTKELKAVKKYDIFDLIRKSKLRLKGLVKGLLKRKRVLPKSGFADIFVLNGGYDVSYVEDRLGDRVIGPIGNVKLSNDRSQDMAEKLISLYQTLLADRTFIDFFSYQQINLFPIYADRLSYYFTRKVVEQYEWLLKTDHFINSFRPSLMISSMLKNANDKAVAVAFRNRNIPVVIYYHGACGYSKNPILYYTDIGFCDHFIVGGDGAKAHFERHYGKKCRFVSNGSAVLDRIKAKKDGVDNNRKKKTVVYVLTGTAGNTRYVSYKQYSDIEYFLIQRQVLEIFKNYTDYDYIIKLMSSEKSRTPIREHLKRLKLRNCRLIKDVDFDDLLDQGDIFIFDWPMTAFMQALVAGKDVLILDMGIPLDKNALKILDAKHMVAHTKEEFVNNIQMVLKDKRLINTAAHQEFLSKYGTHLDDGKSSERFISFINNVGARN